MYLQENEDAEIQSNEEAKEKMIKAKERATKSYKFLGKAMTKIGVVRKQLEDHITNLMILEIK